MSSHASSSERSILWIIVPVAFGLTLMFAMVNRSLNISDRPEVAAGQRISFETTAAAPEHAHKEMMTMPADTMHSDTTHVEGSAHAADTLAHH
jgi:hypothetical protein